MNLNELTKFAAVVLQHDTSAVMTLTAKLERRIEPRVKRTLTRPVRERAEKH